MAKSNGPGEIRKALECVLDNEETQFLREISKLLNVIYENYFRIRAIFQCGPFSVNPHTCGMLPIDHLQSTFYILRFP